MKNTKPLSPFGFMLNSNDFKTVDSTQWWLKLAWIYICFQLHLFQPLKIHNLYLHWIPEHSFLLLFLLLSRLVMSDSCNPMDCRPPGSSVHGIFQAKLLELVAISFSVSIYSAILSCSPSLHVHLSLLAMYLLW